MSSMEEQYAAFQMTGADPSDEDGNDPELDQPSLSPPDGEEPDRAAEFERARREMVEAQRERPDDD